jgi:hypothetical protein
MGAVQEEGEGQKLFGTKKNPPSAKRKSPRHGKGCGSLATRKEAEVKKKEEKPDEKGNVHRFRGMRASVGRGGQAIKQEETADAPQDIHEESGFFASWTVS